MPVCYRRGKRCERRRRSLHLLEYVRVEERGVTDDKMDYLKKIINKTLYVTNHVNRGIFLKYDKQYSQYEKNKKVRLFTLNAFLPDTPVVSWRYLYLCAQNDSRQFSCPLFKGK